jgi:hypothetical protein
VWLRVASAGGDESIMLSAHAESMDTLSTGAESILLSAPSTESMHCLVMLLCYTNSGKYNINNPQY